MTNAGCTAFRVVLDEATAPTLSADGIVMKERGLPVRPSHPTQIKTCPSFPNSRAAYLFFVYPRLDDFPIGHPVQIKHRYVRAVCVALTVCGDDPPAPGTARHNHGWLRFCNPRRLASGR